MHKAPIKRTKAVAEDLEARAHLQWANGELRSAFRLFLAAAKLGHAYTQHTVGYFYDVGLGVKRNRTAAMHWYKLAYRKGIAGSANNIGTIFRDEGDTKQALAWFERAVSLGENEANLEIAKLLLKDARRSQEAVPYLNCVIKAEPGGEITEAYRDEAARLLKALLYKKRSGGTKARQPALVRQIAMGR